MAQTDQTWYFVIADCDGHLEIMRDEISRKDHLLGLSLLWNEIDKTDYEGFEVDSNGDKLNSPTKYLDTSDDFEQSNLMQENMDET